MPLVAPNETETTAMTYPVALLHFTPAGSAADALPLAAHWRPQHTVTMRSSWADANDTSVVAFKGLNVSSVWAHQHLDATTWGLWRGGLGWVVIDLGNDDYAVPGYFSPTRWHIYRCGTQGHNTLHFADGDGNVGLQACTVTGTYSTTDCPPSPLSFNLSAPPSSARSGGVAGGGGSSSVAGGGGGAGGVVVDAWGVVNASDAYSHLGVRRAARGFVVHGGTAALLIVDEVDAPTGRDVATVRWAAHTAAVPTVAPGGLSVSLATPGSAEVVTLKVLPDLTDCPGLAAELVPIDLQPPQLPTPGVVRVQFVAPAGTCARIAVSVGLDPVVTQFGPVRPLADWPALGPFGG